MIQTIPDNVYYVSGWFVDPLGPSSGFGRIVRGGMFLETPANLRSADRGNEFCSERGERGVGFRCVRVPPDLSR